MGIHDRAVVAAKFAIDLDDSAGGWLYGAEGGQGYAELISERLGADQLQRKHASPVKFEDITFTFGTGMSKHLYQWIADSFKLSYSRRDGAIVSADFNLKEIGRLDFHQALISEIGLPALDASSKEPARMTLKISPEWTKNKPRKTPGESIAGRYPIDPRKQKRWMPCNFRLRIDGLEEACKRVSKIEALTIKQKNVELSVGEHRYNLREPASLEIPNLVITLTEHAGQGFYDWHEKFVLEGHNTPEYEKTGTLEYLDSNMKDILFVCHFHHLGILKLTPDKLGAEEIRRMKVEMYCESMEWEFKCAWD